MCKTLNSFFKNLKKNYFFLKNVHTIQLFIRSLHIGGNQEKYRNINGLECHKDGIYLSIL